MSTVQPHTEGGLAAKVRAKGALLVECPVGGSIGPAGQGKLIGLMGAEPVDAARARPILEQLCRRLEHCGPVGSGAVMKLTINMPLMIYWQALGEALALCRPLGLDPARIMDLLADTSGGPNVLKVRGAGVAQMLKGGDGGPVTFDVDSAVKDLRTMLAEGKARGIELPLVEKTLACYEETKRNVSGAAEVSAVSVYWANRAKQGSETIRANALSTTPWSRYVCRHACSSFDHRRRRAQERPRHQLRAADRRRARRRRTPGRVQARGQVRPLALRHRLRQGLGRARHGLRLAHARCARGQDPAVLHYAGGRQRWTHGHQSRRRAGQNRGGRHYRRGRHFRRYLRPRRGLCDRRHRGGGTQSRSRTGRELRGTRRLRTQ